MENHAGLQIHFWQGLEWLSEDWVAKIAAAFQHTKRIKAKDDYIRYYEAAIDEISENGNCSVTFTSHNHSAVTDISKLKPSEKRSAFSAGLSSEPGSSKVKKQINMEHREYKKKKQQKKAQRVKQMEEEREDEKSKWQQFNAKAFSKNKRGHVKKSIFASPESTSGRVGVGTCGIGGKPMTDFQHAEKYKKSLH
ncbi:Survival of motor neuron-related-splicing factor 30 [Nymphon striatum]|nr:Survival of motor neuron-related-splicing factor 30 [Nymphon striatum]